MPALPAALDVLLPPPPPPRRALPWPAPALLTWLAAWALAWALLRAGPALGWPPVLAWAAAASLGAAVAGGLRGASGWRRLMVAGGFPVSALAAGAAAGLGGALPAWAWLLPLAALLLAYPLRAWRDAPLFPTPAGALAGLAAAAPLPAGARVLDAGCGLGHGLAALHAQYPQARLEGIEWSWPWRLAAAARCRWARVRQGDMWAADWSGQALVYLFQRPESMARALAKAEAEMAPGAWLASLEFAVPGVAPAALLRPAGGRAGGKPVWLYRVGTAAAAGHAAGAAAAAAVVATLATAMDAAVQQAAQSAPVPADNPLNKPAQPGRR